MTLTKKKHKKNIKNLTYIISFLNSINDKKIPASSKEIKKIYESQFYIANTLLYIFGVLNRPITISDKKKIIKKIKDPDNRYIFNESDLNHLIKFQRGGSFFFLEDLEKSIGPKFSIVLQMVSMFNETMSYFCAMTVAFLRLPPFSLPPISPVLSIPKLLLKLVKLFFIGSNIFINLFRRNWVIVIRSGVASFGQFMITQNAVGTQLHLANQTLKIINKQLDNISSNLLGK